MTKRLKLNGEGLPYFLLIIPAVFVYALFFLYPTFNAFYYSLTNWSDVHPVHVRFVGLKNFAAIMNDELYLAAIKNTLLFAILTTIFQNVCAIPLALALNQRLKSKNFLRSIYFMPSVFSVLVIGYLWNYLLSPTDFGLINQGLQALGFQKINFLGDSKFAMYAVIFTQVWQWAGYQMVIYLANLQSISPEYYEAAKIDGARRFQTFRFVTLPLLLPAITFCTVTSLISGMKVFDSVFALTKGGPGHATETIISVMFNKGIEEGFYAQGSAFGIVFMIVVAVMTFTYLRILRLWEGE
ncbi:carbohydrate ABC transporter permease [Paenibacillus sp. GCM10023252]|uniref:carbohydrate ABC transporter permease n=1 Tax=Paenibacillus sp. GCM10023252 TaxID=3252649 RepID=UPI0036107EE2